MRVRDFSSQADEPVQPAAGYACPMASLCFDHFHLVTFMFFQRLQLFVDDGVDPPWPVQWV